MIKKTGRSSSLVAVTATFQRSRLEAMPVVDMVGKTNHNRTLAPVMTVGMDTNSDRS